MTNKGGRVIDFGQILGQMLSQIYGFLSIGFDQVQLKLKKCPDTSRLLRVFVYAAKSCHIRGALDEH